MTVRDDWTCERCGEEVLPICTGCPCCGLERPPMLNYSRYRRCAFGIIPPTIVILGETYGTCAMTSECPPGECGYERSRRIIEAERAVGESGERK